MPDEIDQEHEVFLGDGCDTLFGDQGYLPDVSEISYGPVRAVIVSSFPLLGDLADWLVRFLQLISEIHIRFPTDLVARGGGKSFHSACLADIQQRARKSALSIAKLGKKTT
jgi:hypothetical protein